MITKKQLKNNLEIAKQVEYKFILNGFHPINIIENKILSLIILVLAALIIFIPYLFYQFFIVDYSLLDIFIGLMCLISISPILLLIHEYGHMIALNVKECFLVNIHRTFCKKAVSKKRFSFSLLAPFFLISFILMLTILINYIFDINFTILIFIIIGESFTMTIGLYSDLNTFLYIQKNYKNNNILIATTAQQGKILVKEIN